MNVRDIKEFPASIRNALFRDGIKSKEELAEFYRTYGKEGLMRISRIGASRAGIIIDYLENG